MKLIIAAAVLGLTAAPALAESHVSGDPEAGEEQFARQCVACHVVRNEEGETLAGRSARTGPNLYGIAGREIAAVEDFRYSAALLELQEAGETWDEEKFVGYVQDPTAWLRAQLDDRRARGKMAYKVRQEEDAIDIYAYLASLAPPPEEGDEEPAEGADVEIEIEVETSN